MNMVACFRTRPTPSPPENPGIPVISTRDALNEERLREFAAGACVPDNDVPPMSIARLRMVEAFDSFIAPRAAHGERAISQRSLMAYSHRLWIAAASSGNGKERRSSGLNQKVGT